MSKRIILGYQSEVIELGVLKKYPKYTKKYNESTAGIQKRTAKVPQQEENTTKVGPI